MKLVALHPCFGTDDGVDPGQQILGRRALAVGIVEVMIEIFALGLAERQHRLAECLRRDGAGVQARTTDLHLAFDDGDALAQLRRLNRRALPGRPAADAQKVELVLRAHGVAPHAGLLRGSPDPPRHAGLAKLYFVSVRKSMTFDPALFATEYRAYLRVLPQCDQLSRNVDVGQF